MRKALWLPFCLCVLLSIKPWAQAEGRVIEAEASLQPAAASSAAASGAGVDSALFVELQSNQQHSVSVASASQSESTARDEWGTPPMAVLRSIAEVICLQLWLGHPRDELEATRTAAQRAEMEDNKPVHHRYRPLNMKNAVGLRAFFGPQVEALVLKRPITAAAGLSSSVINEDVEKWLTALSKLRKKYLKIDPKAPVYRVLIVGGGPVGLLTAVSLYSTPPSSARLELEIVEDKSSYTRWHEVFVAPSMKTTLRKHLGIVFQRGMVIRDLEVILAASLQIIGVPIRYHRKFLHACKGSHGFNAVLLDTSSVLNTPPAPEERVHQMCADHKAAPIYLADDALENLDGNTPVAIVPFDVLIGADGTKSSVRTFAGISFTDSVNAPLVGASHVQDTPTIRDDRDPPLSAGHVIVRFKCEAEKGLGVGNDAVNIPAEIWKLFTKDDRRLGFGVSDGTVKDFNGVLLHSQFPDYLRPLNPGEESDGKPLAFYDPRKNMAQHIRSLKRISAIIPHRTVTMDPVFPPTEKNLCYIEYPLRFELAHNLFLDEQNKIFFKILNQHERHMDVFRTVLSNVPLVDADRDLNDMLSTFSTNSRKELAEHILTTVYELVRDSFLDGSEEKRWLVGTNLKEFLDRVDLLKIFPQYLRVASTSYKRTGEGIPVILAGDATRDSYYLYGDSVSSALRAVASITSLIDAAVHDEDDMNEITDPYHDAMVTHFQNLNANSLWWQAYCGCRMTVQHSEHGLQLDNVVCRAVDEVSQTVLHFDKVLTSEKRHCMWLRAYDRNRHPQPEPECSVSMELLHDLMSPLCVQLQPVPG